ncbi:MAG: TlpA family protein disulfide reductase [Rikenellaceae bacterium]|nr:TlpA family protein disulfide reductase [Rikenellaceae bacterium]
MKPALYPFLTALLLLGGCSRPTRINLCYEGLSSDTIYLSVAPIEEQSGQVTDTLVLTNGKSQYWLDNETPVSIWVMPRDFLFDERIEGGVRTLRNGGGFAELYLNAGEQTTLKAQSHGTHITGEIEGSTLNREVMALRNQLNPMLGELFTAAQNGDYATAMQIGPKLTAQCMEYVEANPTKESAVYALMQLDEESLVEAIERVDMSVFAGIFNPLQDGLSRLAEGQKIKLNAKQTIVEGATAPDFTLSDANGNPRSLSTLRGKWLVLDFWGSWCGWCIKGFPAMKEIYANHNDQMEIIGIACNDTEQSWREAIEQHDLPWLQLFNPTDLQPCESPLYLYGVQGFPTKIILTPEGRIHKIFVGESEDFYREVERVMK